MTSLISFIIQLRSPYPYIFQFQFQTLPVKHANKLTQHLNSAPCHITCYIALDLLITYYTGTKYKVSPVYINSMYRQ